MRARDSTKNTHCSFFLFVPHFYKHLELAAMFSAIRPKDIQMVMDLLKIITHIFFISYEVIPYK